MMILTGKTILSALRPPYPYGGEFVSQFLFALRLCWFPLLISTVAFGYGAPGLQAANFLVLFGALDRLGGFFVLASIREFAPFVDAIVLAGVAGTATHPTLPATHPDSIRYYSATRSITMGRCARSQPSRSLLRSSCRRRAAMSRLRDEDRRFSRSPLNASGPAVYALIA